MADPLPRPRFSRRRALVLLVIVGAIVAAVHVVRPPSTLTIQTGPIGGSYHSVALQYQKMLAASGITMNVVVQPNSMEIVKAVADPGSGVDVGFIAQDVSSLTGAPIATIGQIQLQPLFVFASADLGRRSTLDSLRGRRIVMPPEDSATSAAAIAVLALYDINAQNSTFNFMPLAEGVRQLRDGKFDAGLFMLAPENPLIRELASDTALRLIPCTEARALANHLPFLRPVVLPRGIYNIADAIPPYDTPLLAATVGIVVKQDLHPHLVHALLEAMTTLHRAPTFLSTAGEFPTLSGAQLPAHRIALQYYSSGLPWAYRDLHPWLAAAVDEYMIIGLALLLVGMVILLIGPITDIMVGVLEAVALVLVRRVDSAVTRSGRLTPGQDRMLRIAGRLLAWVEEDHAAADAIAAIRARAA